MGKYIDSEKLIAEIKDRRREFINKGEQDLHDAEIIRRSAISSCNDFLSLITSLRQEKIDMGEVSDGYHTFNELYYYRMLYNAAFFNLLPKGYVHKSKRHHTGEECFGGGWFIVMANLPTGQVSNHYEIKDWELFKVPEKEFADEWDGHTPQEAAKRIYEYLQQEQSEVDLEKEVESWMKEVPSVYLEWSNVADAMRDCARHFYELGLNARVVQPDYTYNSKEFLEKKIEELHKEVAVLKK